MKKSYKSKHHDWWTPGYIIEALLDFEGVEKFACDPCSSDQKNVPAEIQYTQQDDGLKQDWPNDGVIYINPPYGALLEKFMIKAILHASNSHASIWCLVPCRTETRYYHDLLRASNMVFFFQGKISFGESGDFTKGTCFTPMMLFHLLNWSLPVRRMEYRRNFGEFIRRDKRLIGSLMKMISENAY